MRSLKHTCEEDAAARRSATVAAPALEWPRTVSSRAVDVGRGLAAASAGEVLSLQRAAGNQAVGRLLDSRLAVQRQDAGTISAPDAGPPAVAAATPMPGPRTGLTILTELDAIHTAMAAGGHPSKIASPLGGFRTIDDQIKLYAQGRTFAAFKTAIDTAVTAGSVTRAKADEWIKFYDPAQDAHPMPSGGVVTWTFTSRHLTGDAADVVHTTQGWGAPAAFWTALAAAASAQGLQIGPPASDLAHVQRP
jgi:hypothetical protein